MPLPALPPTVNPSLKSVSDLKQAEEGFRIPRPTLVPQTIRNTSEFTGSDDEGWGSDFDDVNWNSEWQAYFDHRFDWEGRQIAGVVGEKPPVPPRAGSKASKSEAK
ncbi:hypothetical protein [Stenotrophomonas oahuensis]|uniref:Uncharacterized protein n=1 Tax=Stenotrophomonas oahuensis TaxID=3003271 RepID=A0ABY9YIW1_9GAMM|nr:hypothetical protein [Stenotrophomonas sp. A5586]WNH50830.1 hypothetical protein PDM29_10505 [Stenotrophomonas sp. A5586]